MTKTRISGRAAPAPSCAVAVLLSLLCLAEAADAARALAALPRGSAEQRCIDATVSADPYMRALSWMAFVVYTCSVADNTGCAALVAAVRVPFRSEVDIPEAIARAARSASACIAAAGVGGGSSGTRLTPPKPYYGNRTAGGRKLVGWGHDVLVEMQNTGVLDALKRICANSRKLALSGETLPELEEFGVADAISAVAVGVSKSALSLSLGLLFKFKGASFVTDLASGWVFNRYFYQANERDCKDHYGSGGCGELGAWALDPGAKAWARSPDCDACAADLTTVCLKHVAQYNRDFKRFEATSNAASSIVGGFFKVGKANFDLAQAELKAQVARSKTAETAARYAAKAAEAEIALSKEIVKSVIVKPIVKAWDFCQSALGNQNWKKDAGAAAAKAVADKWARWFDVPAAPPSAQTLRSRSSYEKQPDMPRPAPTPAAPKQTRPRSQPQPQQQALRAAPKPEPQQTLRRRPAAGPSSGSYTVPGYYESFVLCSCAAQRPCNTPVAGGRGVRMVGTDDCVNCDGTSYPCPSGMVCAPGMPTSSQRASMSFATCV